jgi:pilus assembly protein CpaF
MQAISEISRSVREFLVGNAAVSPQKAVEKIFDARVLEGNSIVGERELASSVMNALTAFGALQPFIDDPVIEEIWVNKPNEIFVAGPEGTARIPLDLDASELRTLVQKMLMNSGRRVDSSMPFVDASLPDGSRLHVVIPDVTATHWSLNIRKFPDQILSLDALCELGSLSSAQAEFLRDAARTGKNILVSGATHSGKTTLLCALLAELEPSRRLITCEETFEIRSKLADWVPMQTRTSNLEGRGEIPLRRLVKEALRMRPGYLVIGEVREAEALDMLIAMNSGVPGACTIHANSAQAALTKLCTLPLLAGPNISALFVTQTAAEAVDLIVHCTYDPAHGRRISDICGVELLKDGQLKAKAVSLV